MNDDTLRIRPSLRIPDRERVLDWLTALLPVFIISALYYRWQALALEALAVGGYLMAARLLARPAGYDVTDIRVAPALASGLLAAFCLPADAPAWLPALMGGIAAAVERLPSCLRRRWKNCRLTQLPVHPVIVVYILARVVFPDAFIHYTMPAQFSGLDSLTTATPLAVLGSEPAAVELWQLLFGVHAGAIGETCAAAILLSALYLILRRRVRLIAPACMLAVVALLSWLVWGAPLHALLAGGLLLAALMLADRTYAPTSARDQIVVGVVAALTTVLVRCSGGWTEGVALGVLVAQVLTPFLPFVYKLCRIVWAHIAQWTAIAWRWARPYLARLGRFVAAKAETWSKALWQAICRGANVLAARIKELLAKRKNNS